MSLHSGHSAISFWPARGALLCITAVQSTRLTPAVRVFDGWTLELMQPCSRIAEEEMLETLLSKVQAMKILGCFSIHRGFSCKTFTPFGLRVGHVFGGKIPIFNLESLHFPFHLPASKTRHCQFAGNFWFLRLASETENEMILERCYNVCAKKLRKKVD